MTVQSSHPVGPGAHLQGKRAGVVTRTIAGAVDYVLVAGATATTYAAVAVLTFLANPTHWSMPRWAVGWLLALGGVYLFLYLTVTWATGGKTIGGQVMGTRVVFRGERVHLARASLRAAFTVVFPIGLFWSALNRRSRSVQDILTGTTVVYAWRSGL